MNKMSRRNIVVFLICWIFTQIRGEFQLNPKVAKELVQGQDCRNILLDDLYSGIWQNSNKDIRDKVNAEIQGLANFLESKGLPILEGHSGSFPTEQLLYIFLAQNPCVKTICEIGFNAGHSALLWLVANPTAKVVMFDLFDHNYCPYGLEFIKAQAHLNPDRISVVIGDSTRTVNKFHADNPHIQCDLLSIDGGHQHEIAVADLQNMFHLANPAFNILALDDTNCDAGYCVDEAMYKVMSEGVIQIYEGISEDIWRGVSVGTFLRDSSIKLKASIFTTE